jgi:thymidylate synthase (FAD)
MKVVNQNAEIWYQEPGKQGMYKQIERAARVCYQSQNLIKDGSAEKIVKRLIDAGHTAMLEHGTVYLKYDFNIPDDIIVRAYSNDPYSFVRISEDNKTAYITTNWRVIVENVFLKKNWSADHLKCICEPTEFHEKRHTICLTTNLQVATEFIRHRHMSFAMESTRYCAYDKDRFGNDITFIMPCWFNEKTDRNEVIEWSNTMQDCENHYMRLRDKGWAAEQCAQFLPKATKTTLIITAYDDDWQKFFDLRYFEKTGKVHPQAKEAAAMIYELMYNE